MLRFTAFLPNKINGIQRQTSVAAHVLALTSCSYAWPDRTNAFRLLSNSTVSLTIFDRTARGDNENRGTQPRSNRGSLLRPYMLRNSRCNNHDNQRRMSESAQLGMLRCA